jgi:autotransporter-associated beta strand protein
VDGKAGTLSVTKDGAGTWKLTGTNTYTGGTTISNGKLLVNGSLTGSGAVSVASGATLGGSGSIAGATMIGSGGIHAPGNSPGVQAFTSALTYTDGSIFSWEIDRTKDQAIRGTGYDAVNVTGTLAGLDGADANTTTDAIFRIIIGDAGFTDDFWTKNNHTWANIFTESNGTTVKSSWAGIFGGGFEYYNTNGTFSLSDNTLSWNYSAVPEPSSVLAGLLLGAGLLRRRR